MDNSVVVRASRAEVIGVLRGLPNAAQGGSPLVRLMLIRIGLVALARIRDAFKAKAIGGTDETGLRWLPLSPKTIAYSRRHPGVPKRRPFWDTHPSYKTNNTQRGQWWFYYRQLLGKYHGNKGHAAAVAWIILRKKHPGFKSLMDLYGRQRVEILNDTGLLLNSLSPAVEPDEAKEIPQVKQQVFRIEPGAIVLGTRRKGARANHRGEGRPKRPLWPEPSQWPKTWWDDILEQARLGMAEVAKNLMEKLK